ncbi:MAG: hypothetical protein OEV64_05970 [Desulfobulbaceae bacterium]|nr:hypothetical protein [Desulfobulbaceae bacterium]
MDLPRYPDHEIITKTREDSVIITLWLFKAERFRMNHQPGAGNFHPPVIGRMSDYLRGKYRVKIIYRKRGSNRTAESWYTTAKAKYCFVEWPEIAVLLEQLVVKKERKNGTETRA